MKKGNFTYLIFLLVFCLGLFVNAQSQTPWSGVYGNEWIVYGQSYVKVTVTQEGIQKIPIASLPALFQTPSNRSKIQVWYRGLQIGVIKVDGGEIDLTNAEILFYGVRNDGKSDELLYRPGPSARVNTYVSLFSDNSAYYLTVGVSDGIRAERPTQVSIIAPAESEQFHLNTELKVLMNTSSHDPTDMGAKPPYINSFYEEGRSLTGSRLTGNVIQTKNTAADENTRFKLSVTNLNTSSGITPRIKLLVQGRYFGDREIKIYVLTKTGAVIRTAYTVPQFKGFECKAAEFDVQPGDIVDGEIYLGFESTLIATSERFSVSYYSVTYPQNLNMQGQNYYKFNLTNSAKLNSQVQIAGLPAETVNLYDITDTRTPKVIDAGASDFKVSRMLSNGLTILATTQKVTPVFEVIAVNSISRTPDFIIISADVLFDGAELYANYRSKTVSPKGQNFIPLTVKITDIYNQFNYGEPSPVAIRRFIEYMLSGADKNKFLLLVGRSTTYEREMTRELPNNVPAVGYPGSDELLVDGLGGTRQDVPAIPYGRIPANDAAQLSLYLEKLKEYESGKLNPDFSWRNKILHVNGGFNVAQSVDFKNYLQSLVAGNLGITPYQVIKYVKGGDSNGNVADTLDLSGILPLTLNELKVADSGVGMITFYGHGTTYRTDNNISYVTDESKGYLPTNRYSSMFFFGCDVNNIYKDRISVTPPYNVTSGALPLDWIFAPNRGAITVFGNSWEGYSTAFEPYMDILYPRIFVSDSEKKPIGTIMKEVANIIVPGIGARASADYKYYQANIHQTVLLGDPAIKILNTTPITVLPVKLSSFTAVALNDNSVALKWTTVWEKNNSHFVVQKSYDAKSFEAIGHVEGKGTIDEASSYTFNDVNPLPGINYYRLLQVDAEKAQSKESYSNIVAVGLPDSDLLVVSPNPTASDFQIDINSRLGMKFWNLLDVNGKKLKANALGKNVSLSNYPSGTYILEIVTESKKIYRKKIVKQ